MDSTRQQKFARLIQKEISDLFTKEGKNFFGNAFITVTNARVTPDLSLAYIYLSMFREKEPKKLLEQIELHHHEIRKKLGLRIRTQMRHIPDLKFFHDDSLDYVEKIENIFKKIDIPKGEN